MSRGPKREFPKAALNELQKTVMNGFGARAVSISGKLTKAVKEGNREQIAKCAKQMVKNLRVLIDECYNSDAA